MKKVKEVKETSETFFEDSGILQIVDSNSRVHQIVLTLLHKGSKYTLKLNTVSEYLSENPGIKRPKIAETIYLSSRTALTGLPG